MNTSSAEWQHYFEALNAVRERMLAREEAQRHPRVREQALYAIQALMVASNQMYVLPRQNYPQFYTLWQPVILNWGGPASDFLYHWSFIDGRRTYRVRARRGATCFTDLQVFTGHFGDERMRSLGNYDLSEFQVSADGNIEIIVSPQPHDKNWIPLDATEPRVILHVRDVFNDWGATPASLRIECLDRPADTLVLTEEEIGVRLTKAARMVEQNIARALGYAKRVKQLAGGVNAFAEVRAEDGESKDHGASPRAGYYGMAWDIGPDDALIIETPAPQARYWSVQLMDLWWGTLDFTYHQSGLNGAQAQLDEDGIFRAVLSYEDPGVPNWLDPLRTPIGQAMLRWYDGAAPEVPQVRKVPCKELRSHLPGSTPVITGAQRAERLARRTRDSLQRWNL